MVARTGATILSWQVPGEDGELVDLSDGYRSGQELNARDGFRNAVLAPWSNRIRDGRYTWRGTEYDVQPGETGVRDGLHGLVSQADFELRGDAGAAEPRLTLVTSIAPDEHAGYPFSVDVTVTYGLETGADGQPTLTVELTATNTGDEDAPAGLGWHPYFRLPGHETIDDLELSVPARTRVIIDEGLIPLPGDAAFETVEPAGDIGLGPVGDAVVDQAFTDLIPGSDGSVTSVIRSPRTGDSLTLRQDPDESRIVHVFTGDILARDRRASMAVEPCSFGADTLNRDPEAMTLAPGSTRRLRAEVVYRRG
ncbi:aldose 1-epimerase [Georgenia halophila]|uniref:Aldose 1-epimerase n=1 Tax=Georgenia halophila TaxID=620889 RepID=A0ABP8LQI9_9MICO